MDVCVLSHDLMFFTAAEGAIVAAGHSVRQAESLDDVGAPDLAIADFVSFSLDMDELAGVVPPESAVIFTPHERTDVFTGGRARGFAGVYRRGALAKELPRILNEHAPVTFGQ